MLATPLSSGRKGSILGGRCLQNLQKDGVLKEEEFSVKSRGDCLLGGWKERPTCPGLPKTFPGLVLKASNLRQTEMVG